MPTTHTPYAHTPSLVALMQRRCINHAWETGMFVNDDNEPICRTCAMAL